MSKRSLDRDAGDRPPKRSKPDTTHRPYVAAEDIQFARQLQQLLTFRQDGIQQLRTGIASFKNFLESILYRRDEEDRARQLSILREFLDSQKPADLKDTEKPFLVPLWQAWSFAIQSNNDHLASSVSALFALLLRTLSSLLDFRDHGILLCRTALLHEHLRLVRRGLDAPKHKDFVISPCLRLLTEVVSFDGGVMAKEVYKRREQTFDIGTLRRNLGLARPAVSEEDSRRKPSVRTLTARYVLSHLKYLHEGGKIDLLKSRPLCISLFQHLPDDPADLVNEVLSVSEQSVLKDSELPRSAKAMLLLQHNLERVTEVATRLHDAHPSAGRALAWLKAVCSTPSYGLLRPSGWYPPGTANTNKSNTFRNSSMDLGLDSLEFYDRTDRSDVRNKSLLGWIQTLRPHTNSRERELLIMCFESAPELVATYFAEKNMQLDPKLSNTWIGYASFLFESIRLTIPSHLGNTESSAYAELPPQSNIVLENLIPRPLTQKILIRCLNQSNELITFFATRLLVLVFQKLSKVQADMHRAAEASVHHKALWAEARKRLLVRFSERAPPMKDIISTFRKLPDDAEHVMQRETITKLLSLYYTVVPVQALEEQFDISIALTGALPRGDKENEGSELYALHALELQHLLTIARHSPSMKWYNKQGSLVYSPITSLLKLHASDSMNCETRELLLRVLQDRDIIVDEMELQALVASLLNIKDNDGEIWNFIDDCMARASRQPVKYVDQLENAAPQFDLSDQTPVPLKYSYDSLPGLLCAAIVEQIHFATKKHGILRWANSFFKMLCNLAEYGMNKGSRRVAVALALKEGIPKARERVEEVGATDASLFIKAQIPDSNATIAENDTEGSGMLSVTYSAPPLESDNHPELVRWAQKDLGIAIEDGDVDALMLCLCSKHSDIRRQARAQLKMLVSKLQSSALDEKDQLSVLGGELVETFEQQCFSTDKHLPYVAGTFATRALRVLQEPTHHIYPKLNRYLIKSPEWRINRMPSYWLANTVLSRPEEDGAYWKNVQWVLDWLVDGLRTTVDLDICRRGGVFEKAMALYSSPAASASLVKEKVLILLYRATFIEGGSTVLITRAGVLAWLDMVGRGSENLASLLKKRVLDTCDRKRIEQWSGACIGRL